MEVNNANKQGLLPVHCLYQVLDTLADITLCVDNQLRLIYLNPSARCFFGYSPGDMLGGSIASLLPEEYHDVHARFLTRCFEDDPARLTGRLFRLKLLSRSSFLRLPVSLSLSVEDTDQGRMLVAIIRRRMAVHSLAEDSEVTENELRQSLASVCHEIRNPLVSIGGFARLVERDSGLSSKSRHQLQIIQEEVERLERLVNGLRDLTKISSSHFEYTDMVELFTHVYEIMVEQARQENKQIVLDIMSDPPRLLLDKDRISQVLINLVQNGLQACQPGGRVTMRLGRAPRSEFLKLDIIDNGQGISDENMEKLFQPFFTTKKGGTGLGLSVSKRIVEDHGGYLEVQGKRGQGTMVSICLPL